MGVEETAPRGDRKVANCIKNRKYSKNPLRATANFYLQLRDEINLNGRRNCETTYSDNRIFCGHSDIKF
jgi:hypothetical protein